MKFKLAIIIGQNFDLYNIIVEYWYSQQYCFKYYRKYSDEYPILLVGDNNLDRARYGFNVRQHCEVVVDLS